MTKKESAILSAYTGVLCGPFDAFHEYVEQLMGRTVFTHELPALESEIKKRSKQDFMNLAENTTD